MTNIEFKDARKNLGLTQVELADTLGMTRQHIGFLESGRSPVQKQTVLALDQLSHSMPREQNALDDMFKEPLSILSNLSIR